MISSSRGRAVKVAVDTLDQGAVRACADGVGVAKRQQSRERPDRVDSKQSTFPAVTHIIGTTPDGGSVEKSVGAWHQGGLRTGAVPAGEGIDRGYGAVQGRVSEDRAGFGQIATAGSRAIK